MSPAFSSTRQAAGFVLIAVIILLSPWLAGTEGLASREQVYATLPWRLGLYPYIQQQIFQKSGDIDIAFMGSSHIVAGIDPGYVQKCLSEKLGRPAVVVTMGWGKSGFDALYFIARDLLLHRKVHTLVFYDDQGTDAPQVEAWRLVRFGDDGSALTGLSLRLKIIYYYGAILGMPRDLIGLLRPGLPANPYPNLKRCVFRPPVGWLDPGLVGSAQKPDLSDELPPHTARDSDVEVFSDSTAAAFDFSAQPVPPLQSYFAKKIARLARDHGTQLVCLNLPVLDDRRNSSIKQSSVWPEALRSDSTLIGIPPSVLFGGMDDSVIKGLYSDSAHMNQTGQAYFTQIITPRLLQIYDETQY